MLNFSRLIEPRRILLPVLFLLFFWQESNSQSFKATSDCNSITATFNGYNNLWGTNMFLGSCNDGHGNCCQKIINWSGWFKSILGPPVVLKPINYRLYEEGGFLVAGPQSSPTFTNVPHGTYQIRAEVPIRDFCTDNSPGPISMYGYDPEQRLDIHVGYKGHLELRYTNWTIVGNTTPNDHQNFLTDDGWGEQFEFCPTDNIIMYDGSPNHDRYWIAIFENGWPDRSVSTLWQNGTIHNNYNDTRFDISALWRKDHPDWDFEEGTSYTVQVVIENSSCLNTPQWNEKRLDFVVVPCFSDGSGDRAAQQSTNKQSEISITPNPASSMFVINNLDWTGDQKVQIDIRDLAGKSVINSDLYQPEVDVSNLPNGLYIVSVFQIGHRVFSDKLIIQH